MTQDQTEVRSRLLDLIGSRGEDSGVASLDAGGALPPDQLLDSSSTTIDITAGNATVILVDANSINVIVNLLEATDCENYTYYIKKIDTSQHSVFILPYAGDTIDKEEYIEIREPMTCITIYCDGSEWWII